MQAAKNLTELDDDLSADRQDIIKNSLKSLRFIAETSPLAFYDEVASENSFIDLLRKVAPRHPKVVRNLLKLSVMPLAGTDVNGERIQAYPEIIESFVEGPTNWPLKSYLLDAAQHSPQTFYLSLVARRNGRAGVLASSFLVMAKQFSMREYQVGVQRMIRQFETQEIPVLTLLPGFIALMQIHRHGTVDHIIEQALADVESVLQRNYRGNVLSLSEGMLERLGIYASIFAELRLAKGAEVLENLYEDAHKQLSRAARLRFKLAQHYAKTGKRDLKKVNDAELMIRRLEDAEDRSAAVSAIRADEDEMQLFAYGIAVTSPRDRRQYLDDLIYVAGKPFADQVIKRAISMGGPDLQLELSKIGLCAPLQGGLGLE